MPTPGEHKTVQARILAYAQEIGWTFVPRAEARRGVGFDPDGATPEDRARTASLYFGDLLHERGLAFNPKYKEAEGALVGEFQRLNADIAGNRDFLTYLRNQGKFFCAEENRELDLMLIDYAQPDRNVYEVTEEFYVHNGRYGTREEWSFSSTAFRCWSSSARTRARTRRLPSRWTRLRRYHAETPEVMVPEMIFSATEAIGFAYGVTWNTVRRNIFNWKHSEAGNLEAKVKSFCAVPQVLRFLKDFILFAEKEEELQKFILRQHQMGGADKVVARALDPKLSRGLVWHTQGSGKTYTMIKASEMLFKAPEAEKPTILLMIDRNELEDQMLKNLASVGLANVAHASSIAGLNRLLREDYRGIIVTMIHKFRDMPANLNTRKNIYVLIDEAHRTTGGDLGNFLMAGLPNATFIGFTGTPVDKTVYGKGTFKTFGCEDDKGYLHKYSIAESIEDGTTLPLYYQLAPNEMLVPHEIMEKEFLALAETEGIADIEELNKILERAVNLKNFLKGKERVKKVAGMVADHFRQNIEPLGYKAFLVAVDREACVFYKEALDAILPPEYSEIVFTGNNNDPAHLKKWHLDPKRERQIRKDFTKLGEWPKILIVTEKLLTGFDAPILYAMYLDKPMRDHTLLQAIARVNRPYENEAAEMVKPHGFVLDFVGIFDKLEKALAFDSDEINAIVKDIGLLKQLFRRRWNESAGLSSANHAGIQRQGRGQPDRALPRQGATEGVLQGIQRDRDALRDHFAGCVPAAFHRRLRHRCPVFMKWCATPMPAAYMWTAAFQKKTNELVQRHIGARWSARRMNTSRLTIPPSKQSSEGRRQSDQGHQPDQEHPEDRGGKKRRSISHRAGRARQAVQESFEDRQTTTEEALADLLTAIEKNEQRKKEQAAKGWTD